MRFDPRLLEVFVLLARTGSFSATAEQTGIGQPAVSRQVRRLEQQLGLRLFERTTRAVELTSEGAELLPLAIEALRRLSACEEAADLLGGSSVPPLTN